MVFSSLTFLLYFLPITLAVYYLVPKRFLSVRNIWLLAVSLCFYGMGGLTYLPLLVITIMLNYLYGLLAAPQVKHPIIRKLGVLLAVLTVVGLLGYYKYANFFTENLAAIGLPVAVLNITLPVGISFFTFQAVSYVIDVYRGDAPVQKNPLYVALYVAFFPQLVAGPIVRYTTVAEEIRHREETLEEFAEGLTRFCFGLGKKMLIANPMGEIADTVFSYDACTLPAGLSWIGIVAYLFQLYFDFSAYSDMAIGLGRMFGFHFLENFRYPYISKSFNELWSRWHISLSSWFKDYVYIPLGGSRAGKAIQIRNMLIVWLLTGLWHGAAWHYVVWGLCSFLFLVGEKRLWGKGLEKTPALLRQAITVLLFLITLVFFRAPNLKYAFEYFASMFGAYSGIRAYPYVFYLKQYWIEWIAAILASLPITVWLSAKMKAHPGSKLCRFTLLVGPKLIALLLLAAAYVQLVVGSFNPFIYFQF